MLWASCALPESNPHQSQDGERGHAAAERSRGLSAGDLCPFHHFFPAEPSAFRA